MQQCVDVVQRHTEPEHISGKPLQVCRRKSLCRLRGRVALCPVSQQLQKHQARNMESAAKSTEQNEEKEDIPHVGLWMGVSQCVKRSRFPVLQALENPVVLDLRLQQQAIGVAGHDIHTQPSTIALEAQQPISAIKKLSATWNRCQTGSQPLPSKTQSLSVFENLQTHLRA
jgi:hypothetical protein